jgi:glycosyltransferase involved in cell wall biosynthesis
MRIAIMGIRGIPACYGGFETFAEELATRLVKRGHDVIVYGRSHFIKYKKKTYKGVRLEILPTIRHKYLDTIFHTFLSVIHAFFNKYDVILICNATNSLFSLLPRLSGKKVVVNVDGIERKRKKWNWLGKLWYLFGELFAVAFPNVIVSDARVIQEYYKRRYRKDSLFIPYGAYTNKISSTETLKKYGIRPHEYLLYVSRLEPENNAHLVIEAFESLKTDKKLVIVGDAPYAREYIDILKNTNDPRIVFTGFVFGKGYKEFQSHAYCYIHATEVGGTHPALIEAMGFANYVIANGTPENIEVLQGTGTVYKKNSVQDLKDKLQYALDHPADILKFGELAKQRVERHYNWEKITDQYEELFKKILR